MKTTMFWSCTGIDASELSFGTAKLLAEEEKTLIAELPCLGIPRLGFTSGIMDRGRNTEMAIMQFEQGKNLQWDMVHSVSRRLAVLPASVFATPDYPVATKVNINTLIRFVPALQKLARSHDCGRLVLECQGQLNSPMAFFSLKAAGQVVIPLGKPTDTPYALASVRRLVQIYKHQADKFILAAVGNIKAIESVAFADSREEGALGGLRVTTWDSRKIKTALSGSGYSHRKSNHSTYKTTDPVRAASWGALLKQEVASHIREDSPLTMEGGIARQVPDGLSVSL